MNKLYHPVSAIFPLMSDEDLTSLASDIEQHGLRNAVWLAPDGSILDGRNRDRACRLLGIQPRYRTWEGTGSLVAFVVSQNLRRRHLTPSQAAAVAVEMLPFLEAEARQRQVEAGKQYGRGKLSQKVDYPIAEVRAADEAAAMTQTNRQYVYDAKKLKDEDPAAYEQVRTGEKTISEVRKESRQAERAKQAARLRSEALALPQGPFRVIVLDPPWRYGSRAEDITHRARNPYPDMPLDDIAALPVPILAHSDCVLWLWTTNAFLPLAFGLLEGWGFEYKTALTWVKHKMGVGDWLRGQTEHCLFAVRGKPIVTLTNQTTALLAPAREHSRKPCEFYELVDSLCPGSKLEMFARERRPNWEAWGAELEKK